MFVVKKSLSASNFKANKWHVYTERDKMQWLNNGDFKNTVKVSNSLDPDQTRHFRAWFGSNLDG